MIFIILGVGKKRSHCPILLHYCSIHHPNPKWLELFRFQGWGFGYEWSIRSSKNIVKKPLSKKPRMTIGEFGKTIGHRNRR